MKRKITKRVISFLTTLIIIAISSNAFAIDAPVLTVSSSGLNVSLSWTSVPSATGYTLYYAPYPYAGEHTISNADMRASTLFSATLWNGASYYVAMTAYNAEGQSNYSNIEHFVLEDKAAEASISGVWTLSTTSEEILSNPYGECYVTDIDDVTLVEFNQQDEQSFTLTFLDKGISGTGTITGNQYQFTIEGVGEYGFVRFSGSFTKESVNSLQGTSTYDLGPGICTGRENFVGEKQ